MIHSDDKPAITALRKIVINDREYPTLAQELSHEDVVFGAGSGKSMKGGTKFEVKYAYDAEDDLGRIRGGLLPKEKIKVVNGMRFTVMPNVHALNGKSNGSNGHR